MLLYCKQFHNLLLCSIELKYQGNLGKNYGIKKFKRFLREARVLFV